MARIRSLKPDFWLDRKLARRLSRDERLLYMGLWNQADEHARALGDPVVIKGAIFPYDDDLTVDAINQMLNRLDTVGGVVQRYEADGDPFLYLPKLADHQRLEPAKSKSKHPEPPPRAAHIFSEESAQIHGGAEIVSEFHRPEPDPRPPEIGIDQREHQSMSDAEVFSDEPAHDSNKSALLYGTGNRGQGEGRAAQVSPHGAEPPSPHCSDHPNGTTAPCRGCADGRRAAEAFEAAERRRRATEESERKRHAAEIRARAIANCNLCDAEGYAGGRVCSHDPEEVDRAKRGSEAVRAALAQRKASP
jgi:hypothetical protein